MKEEDILNRRCQIETYLGHSRRALESAASNREHGFYATAINRAYYAMFYAASGLLLTKGISRGKHAGVIAAFRQRCVKSGLIETEYSELYGAVMESRISGDYEVAFEADLPTAEKALHSA
jgi:uncharacterized protein (UPF0332 family)